MAITFRKTTGHLIASVSLVTTLLLGMTTTVYAQTDAEYQRQLDKLKTAISKITNDLDSVKSTRSELEKELQKSETRISELNQKVQHIQEALIDEKKQLAALQSERAALEEKRKTQQDQAGQYINAAYQLGQQSELKLLLNQEDPAKVSRLLTYYDFFIQAHSDKIQTYLNTLQRLAELEPAIVASTQKLQNDRQQLLQQQEKLRSSQAQRKTTLAKLNSDITAKQNSLQTLQRDRKRLQQLLDEMSQMLGNLAPIGDSTPFSKRQGKMPWPTQGHIKSTFGSRRNGGLNWDGVFIESKEGTPVKAIHTGHVVFSDYLRGQGMLIIIDHGNGYMSLYAHNQTLLKDTGEWIQAGETIAKVGNSGGLSTPGLYFEIRRKGNPVNPAKWCRGQLKRLALR